MKSEVTLILGSGSPRRKDLLEAMGYRFKTCSLNVDESFPQDMKPDAAVVYLAEKKARAFTGDPLEIGITADTLVYLKGSFLGKPEDAAHARQLLQQLSGNVHQVYTGVCLRLGSEYQSFYDCTEVEFRHLELSEIDYYIRHYNPMDKAGAYGIQEWIGWIGVLGIRGSYSNVMGLPTALLKEKLEDLLKAKGLSLEK